MRVRDWMSPEPVTVHPSTSIARARELLEYYGVRHLPVVRGGHVAGVVSDRDVYRERAGHATDVGEIMSTPPHTVGADEPVEAAARLMLSRHISALPVLDEHSRLVGIITTTDCLLAALSTQAADR